MVLEEHIDVLAGKKLQALGFRDFQVNADDVMCQVFKLVYPAGQGSDLDVSGCIDLTYLYGQVTVRPGLAEQCLVVAGITGIECGRQPVPVIDRTTDDIAHAGAAITIATAIGQYNALAQCRIEDRLGRLDLECMAAGLYGDLVGHSIS